MGLFDIFKKKVYIPQTYNSEGELMTAEYFRKKREEEARFAQKCKRAFENVHSFLDGKHDKHIRKVTVDKFGSPTYVIEHAYGDYVDLCVISGEMMVQGTSMSQNSIPYILCKILEKTLYIQDLPPNRYQNMGYGSMLIEEIIKIAKDKNLEKITGTLSFVDAKTPEDRERRNSFYLNRGFKIERGRIELQLLEKND